MQPLVQRAEFAEAGYAVVRGLVPAAWTSTAPRKDLVRWQTHDVELSSPPKGGKDGGGGNRRINLALHSFGGPPTDQTGHHEPPISYGTPPSPMKKLRQLNCSEP